MPARVRLAELVLGGPPERWERLGFELSDGVCHVGAVRLRFDPAHPGGIAGWSLRDAASRDLDGLPTEVEAGMPDVDAARAGTTQPQAAGAGDPAQRPGPQEGESPASEHPNGAISIDHVVVLTPDFERTTAALARAGLDLRLVREAGEPERPFRQGFYRLGAPLLELMEQPDAPDPGAPAAFWGIVFVVKDLDRLASLLGEQLGSARDAVQPGRRIATLRRSAEAGLPIAFMTPEPARSTA